MTAVLQSAAGADASRQQSLLVEIASRASDPQFFAGLGFLPNMDRVLRKLGRDQEVYDDILGDSHVFAQYQVRKSPTLSRDGRIEPASDDAADKRAADLCTEVVLPLATEATIGVILDAPFYGYRALEIMWEVDGGRVVPAELRDRPNRRLCFGVENELRVRTRALPLAGELAPARKFLVARHLATYENPYGGAVLSRCYWPYTFKHASLKFWVVFTERFGMPGIVGKLPRGASQKEHQDLLAALSRFVQDWVGTIPDDGSVTLLEAARTSSADIYQRLLDGMNAEMSKVILGQTLTTEMSDKGGAYAASKTHNDVRGDLADSDARMVCGVFNELCRHVTELNVPGARAPSFQFFEEDEPAGGWADFLDKARKLVSVPESYARSKLNIAEPSEGEPALAMTDGPAARPAPRGSPGLAQFAASDDWLDALFESAVAESSTAAGAVIDRIKGELGAAGDVGLGDVDALFGRIAAKVGKGPSALEDLLGRTMFMAELQGEAQVAGQEQDFADVAPEPLDWPDAERAFGTRVPMTSAEFKLLSEAVKVRAFTVRGIADMDVLRDVQLELEHAIRDGRTLKDFVKGIDQVAEAKGWKGLSPYQAETVFRNAVQSSYNAARYRAMSRPRVLERRPYWQYDAVNDRRTRPAHKALDGKVFRADDPVWNQIYPPNGHRCRCRVDTLSAVQLKARGLTVENGAEFIDGVHEVDGAMVSARPDAGWATNAGKATWTPDLTKYPPTMVTAFVKQAHARKADLAPGLGLEEWFAELGISLDLVRKIIGAIL